MNSNRLNRALPVLLVLSLLMLSGGCVREDVDADGTQTFSYEMWVPLLVGFAGIFAAVVGFLVRNYSTRVFVAFTFGGFISTSLIAPSLFLDSATVSDDHFSLCTGGWGLTCQYDVDFDELEQVRLVYVQQMSRRGRTKEKFYFVCDRIDGELQNIPLQTPVAQAAASHMMDRLDVLGIPVFDETDKIRFSIHSVRPARYEAGY